MVKSDGSKVLYKYMRKFAPHIAIVCVFAVAQNYLNLMLPELLGELVNDSTISADGISFSNVSVNRDTLISIFQRLLLIFLVGGLFGGLRIVVSQHIGTNVVYGIRQDMYIALQKQSYRFYDKNRTGDIISKATRDVNVSRNFLANQLANLIRDFFTLLILLWKVFSINVQLSLIFLSLIPILFALMIWFRKRMYKDYMSMSINGGKLNSTLEENITGFRVVKAFSREKHELQKFKETNDSFLKSNLRIAKTTSTYGPSQELVTQIGSVFVLFMGATLVINGEMFPGDVVEFYIYYALIYDPIRGMVNTYFQYSQVQGSLTRVNSVLENKSEIIEKPNPIVLTDIKGEYKFENVWFSYGDDDHYALKNLSFKVNPGESIAIIGATGSGKSSLINMVPRFYDPTRGAILLDDFDIRDISIDEYRRKIGIVSQDIFLFSRSIRENITYGLENDVDDEEVERVAKIASIHNFITSLPKGYKTMVGERGQTLSGGQKQRVAIARALLLNPRILILDDSLSAVDIDTEAHIQSALDELFASTTTFIITQRISTIKNCDRILVLDRGEIEELGTHDELYELGGIYTKIYDTMFRASTKRKERAQKIREEIMAIEDPTTIDFEEMGIDISEDIQTLREVYKEKYPDDEQRNKNLERLMKKIEKRQERSDRNILKKKQNRYMLDLIKLFSNKNLLEISEVAKEFYIGKDILEEAFQKWKKVIPFEIKKGTIVIENREEYDKVIPDIVEKIKNELREEQKSTLLKRHRESRELRKSEDKIEDFDIEDEKFPFEIKDGTIIITDLEKYKKLDPEKIEQLKNKLLKEQTMPSVRKQRKMLKDERNKYLEKFLSLIKGKDELELSFLAKQFDVNENTLRNRLKVWSRNFPIEITEDKIRITDLKEFLNQIEQELKEIELENEEKKRTSPEPSFKKEIRQKLEEENKNQQKTEEK